MDKLGIIISVASIIISGLLSWLITSIYYRKTNRKSAFSRCGKKIHSLLFSSPTKKGAEEFLSILADYEFGFLPQKKQKLILDLYHYYFQLSFYDENASKALALEQCFFRKLNENSIDQSHVLKIGYEVPRTFEAFLDNNKYHTFKSEEARLDLLKLFNSLLPKGEELPLSCLDNISIEINKSRPVVAYNNNCRQYEKLNNEFDKIFQKDIPAIWYEMNLENEGYPFFTQE